MLYTVSFQWKNFGVMKSEKLKQTEWIKEIFIHQETTGEMSLNIPYL